MGTGKDFTVAEDGLRVLHRKLLAGATLVGKNKLTAAAERKGQPGQRIWVAGEYQFKIPLCNLQC